MLRSTLHDVPLVLELIINGVQFRQTGKKILCGTCATSFINWSRCLCSCQQRITTVRSLIIL